MFCIGTFSLPAVNKVQLQQVVVVVVEVVVVSVVNLNKSSQYG